MTDQTPENPFAASFSQTEMQVGTDVYQANVGHIKSITAVNQAIALVAKAKAEAWEKLHTIMGMLFIAVLPIFVMFYILLFKRWVM